MIVINRAKAEAVARDRLRADRVPALADLDVAYMRALEAGKGAEEIAKQKQAMRDVTEKPLDSLTIDQLASLTLADALAL